MIRTRILAPLAALLMMVGATADSVALAQGGGPPPRPPIADLAVVAPTGPCEGLAGVDLTDIGGAGSKIASASVTASSGIEVCEVLGTLAPTIGFRITLPTKTWAQRYLQVGCGGLCGNISRNVGAAAGCEPLTNGAFVIGATDMGHSGNSGDFGLDPQKRADFAYRGQHLTRLTAGRLIRAFYGKAQTYAYFSGCSDGGREALIAAQRFPDDFNGVIAGAPAMNFQVQNSLFHAWQYRSNTDANGKTILVTARLPILHRAVLAQCDKLDGLEDGLLSDPRVCKVDLAPVTCKAGVTDISQCLTVAEAEVARKFYDGPRDPVTGERLTIGGPQPGSELAWAGVYVSASADASVFSKQIAMDSMRYVIFDGDLGPNFKLEDVKFDKATFDRLKANHALYDSTNPDLTPFQAKGGKLILWHGWSDPHISPINTIAYHEAVAAQMGAAKADGFERLYLLPGVYHCNGGEGPSSIDMLTAMMAWVEKGVAPGAIVASPPAPRPQAGAPTGPPPGMGPPQPVVTMTRPVLPFPAVAKYVSGDANQPASFTAGPRAAPAGTPVWAGSEFYKPYAPKAR